MAPWMSRRDTTRREKAMQAASAARWMWAIFKGFVLAVLLTHDGELRSGLASVEGLVSMLGYALVYAVSTIFYLILTKSDPGWVPLKGHGGDGEEEEAASVIVEMSALASTCSRRDSATRDGGAAASNDPESEGEQHGRDREGQGGACLSIPSPPLLIGAAIDQAGGVEEGAGEDQARLLSGSGERMGRDSSHCGYCDVGVLPRTKHCRDCGRCCYTFDHHCFWLGTCVGEYNHRLFWWYLFFEAATCAWSCALAGSTFGTTGASSTWMRDWLSTNFAPMMALGISLAFLVMVGGLLFFHTYLLCTGQTTWEAMTRDRISYLKHVPDHVYPFSVGCRGNLASVCLRGVYGAEGKTPTRWALPEPPWQASQKFWWIENEYWSCF